MFQYADKKSSKPVPQTEKTSRSYSNVGFRPTQNFAQFESGRTGFPNDMALGYTQEHLPRAEFGHQTDDIDNMIELPTLNPDNTPMTVVQRHDIISELLPTEQELVPGAWIDKLLEELISDPGKREDLKQHHLNFNKLNEENKLDNAPNINEDDRRTIGDKKEATIYQSIVEQVNIIKSTFGEKSDLLHEMQMGSVLNGIARMLAHKLGDMSATDQILDQLMKKLAPQTNSEQGPTQLNKIKALAKSNPILMYLHHEINSRDAALRLLEQSKMLGKDRAETFELLKHQAIVQIKAMAKLMEQGLNVSAARTSRLSIDDPIGLYSIRFLNMAIEEIKRSEPFQSYTDESPMDKLKRIFLNIKENEEEKYNGKNPAIEKAKRHQNRQDRNLQNSNSVIARARRGVQSCIAACNIHTPDKFVENAQIDEILNTIITKLNSAPIMITRHAEVLLAKELSQPSQGLTTAGEMAAGCPTAYITLDDLLTANKPIRDSAMQTAPSDDQSYIPARTTAPTENKDEYISYTPLLAQDSNLAKNRGVTYPIFRSNKNRLFAGKTHQEKEAVFGTLCVMGARNYHQLWDNGKKKGTYGDVVLIFRPQTFSNYIITFGDRQRGYTDFRAFVYNAFAHKDEVESQDSRVKSDVLITPGNGETLDNYLSTLIRLGLNGSMDNDSFEFIEIQIFDPVLLTHNTISEIYFAQSVTDEQIAAIMGAVSGTSSATSVSPDEEQRSRETKFFKYFTNAQQDNHPLLNTNRLYLKVDDNNKSITKNRPDLNMDALNELWDISDIDKLNNALNNYGTHKDHSWKSRLPHFEAVFEWIREVYRLKKEGKEEEAQDLIDNKISIRKRIVQQN